ncbi:hypothetical protein N0V85_005529 [Neurospora sp. IMI 360204]|nr:hypothetical protein N0V85_005529 [Neurospora sp. IMI 360204]
MGQIYSGADLVISWLGLASDDSDLAIENLKLLRPLFGLPGLQVLESTKGSFDFRTRDAILVFFKRSYCKRVWILEELFLTRKYIALCGSKVITDDGLHDGVSAIKVAQKLFASRFSELIKKTPAVWHIHTKFFGFQWVNDLNRFLSFRSQEDVEATEPRDYIYAFLSVSWDCANGLLTIIPDYDKSVQSGQLNSREVLATVKTFEGGNGLGQISGERYPYRQLEHETTIRLLFITPGSGEEITYTLLHAELGNIPYKALSYEWRLPSDDDPKITIDGHPVRIRKNLFEALKQINSVIHYLGFLFLWVDPLCINQNDNAEKSQQIQKMGKIFSGADEVFAWTGTMANDSDYTMDILNSIFSVNSYSNPEEGRGMVEDKWLELNRAKAAILAWFNRAYWKRVWVIQEIYLAKELVVMCGSKSIAERQLYICLSFLVTLGWLYSSALKDDDDLIPSIKESAAYYQIVANSLRFSQRVANSPRESKYHRTGTTDYNPLGHWLFICASSKFMATDPRDYVYAMLSLSGDAVNGEIIPDYNKPAEKLFKEVSSLCALCEAACVVLQRRLRSEVPNPSPDYIS